MPGMIPEFPIEYWILKSKIEKNEKVQRIRNEIIKERTRNLNRQRKQR